MARLKQKTTIFGVLLSTLLLAGCLVDFGEKDIRQFVPLGAGIEGPAGPGNPEEGFFGEGLFGRDSDIL